MSPARVRNDYAVAQQIEDKDRAVFLEEKSQAESLNDKAVQYQVARQEATQSRTLYENLVGRMKEADLVAGMRSSNITLVDRGSGTCQAGKAKRADLCCRLDCRRTSFWNMRGAASATLRTTASRSWARWRCSSRKPPIGLLPFHDAKSERKRIGVVGIRRHCPFRRIQV